MSDFVFGKTEDKLIERAKAGIWKLAAAEAEGRIPAGFTALVLQQFVEKLEAGTLFVRR